MKTLFYPHDLVIVGVSESKKNMGRTIAENLDRFMFPGDVYLVGRGGGKIGSKPVYGSIPDLPVTPDLAVFLIPASHVAGTLEACGKKGIKRVVIESGGFSEFADEGYEVEQQLLNIAETYGIRFIGPNCISIINLDNGLVLPFMPMDPAVMQKGMVSLISQSGGIVFGGLKLFSCENIGINKLISIGNKVDLNENDYLDYLISDDKTGIIGLYIESVSDGRKLMQIAAATDKPIVVLKSNTSEASNEIASFHTAALAGNDTVCEAAFAQAGMHRVHSFGEMADLFKIFQLPPMRGSNLAVIGRSGGQIVMAADAASENNFNLVRFPHALLEHIGGHARASVIRLTNPLDMGDIFDLGFYAKVVESVLAEPGIDGVVLQHLHGRGAETEATMELIKNVEKLSLQYRKPVAFCLMTERDEWFSLKTSTDFPLFLEPCCAIKALAASRRQAQRKVEPPLPVKAMGQQTRMNAMGQQVLMNAMGQAENYKKSTIVADIKETFELLESKGFKHAGCKFAKTPEKAVEAADLLGYPLALKIASSKIVHKTDEKAVITDIKDRSGFEKIANEMYDNFTFLFRENKAEFMVQQMVAAGGVEVILGTRRDPEFGPVVLFGLGGIFAEVFKDVAIRVAPISENEAEKMITQIKGYPLLAGFRGQLPCDKAALKQLIVSFSHILIDSSEIDNLEINPLIVLNEGKGCISVDARMLIST